MAETTAERILDIAEDLIKDGGYNAFSYEDISRLIGIKKPSIHHHYATKEILATKVLQRYRERFNIALAEIAAQSLSLSDSLQAYAHLFEATFQTRRQLCLCGMLSAEASSLPLSLRQELKHFFHDNQEWLLQIFQRAKEKKEMNSKEKPEKLAAFILASLEGAMIVGRGLENTHLVQQIGETCFKFIAEK